MIATKARRTLRWWQRTWWVGMLALLPVGPVMEARSQSLSTLDETAESIIHYDAAEGRTDPIAGLEARLTNATAKLTYDSKRGYLPALLEALKIPVASQGLVFSKTSSQRDRISPRTPRAIYFNDEVAVGWVPGGQVLEIAAMDPQRGLMFYHLEQNPTGPPRFTRGDDCMRCHLDRRTLNVPGWLVRSTYTAPDGSPLAKVPGFINGHNSALAERWGGWYVTGLAAGDSHLGNLLTGGAELLTAASNPNRNLTNLDSLVDTRPYLAPGSDIVALMVLEHQSRLYNLLIHANYEARYARDWPANTPGGGPPAWARRRIEMAGEMLLEYLLFRDEAPLHGRVTGTPEFMEAFQRAGPHDSRGRSLRDFDLQRRLFRHPCSYLVYSPAFDALPGEMKTYIWTRLAQILQGSDTSSVFATLAKGERTAIREILRETKPEFAAYCPAAK